jgi:TatD family-associated radical SAM protein
LESVFSKDVGKYSEIVFCGYGEPSYRLEDAVFVAKKIKDKFPDMKLRINTNGQSDLILGRRTAPLYEGAFDTVSISLNSSNAEKYQKMCHSVYGNEAFKAILDFTKDVKNYVQNVLLSVVRETLTEEELEECYAIASSVGVTLKVRTYISA